MANFKRNRPRIKGGHGKSRGRWLGHWPAWWDRMFHNRPARRANHRLEVDLRKDRVDPDEALPKVTGHKPHHYYW